MGQVNAGDGDIEPALGQILGQFLPRIWDEFKFDPKVGRELMHERHIETN
jgi:hypothetical protein